MIHVRLIPAEVDALARDTSGPVARHIDSAAQIVLQGQKRRCPTSPRGSGGHPSGYLRSSLRRELRPDPEHGGAITAYVGTDVDYALFPEYGTKPHLIEAPPGGVLAWTDSGGETHFATRVHHPGTPATPYLRPALDDLQGRRL